MRLRKLVALSETNNMSVSGGLTVWLMHNATALTEHQLTYMFNDFLRKSFMFQIR
jgi:hypothetical protein